MNREEARERLQALAAAADDWYTLQFGEGDHFTLRDSAGRSAEGVIAEHWLQLELRRPLDRMLGRAAPTGTGAALLRLTAGQPGQALAQGRLYLDGFSLQAFLTLARDLLALADPATEATDMPSAAAATAGGEPNPTGSATLLAAERPAQRIEESAETAPPTDGIAELAPGAGAGAPAAALETAPVVEQVDEIGAPPLAPALAAFEEGPSESAVLTIEPAAAAASAPSSMQSSPEPDGSGAVVWPETVAPREEAALAASDIAPAALPLEAQEDEAAVQAEAGAATVESRSVAESPRPPLIRLIEEDLPATPDADQTLAYDANPYLSPSDFAATPARSELQPSDAAATPGPEAAAILAASNPARDVDTPPPAEIIVSAPSAAAAALAASSATTPASGAEPPVSPAATPQPGPNPAGRPDQFDPTLTSDRIPSSVGATIQLSRSALGGLSLPREESSPASAPATHTCPRCSADVQTGERFCIRCGAPQPSEAPPPWTRPADPHAQTVIGAVSGQTEAPLPENTETPACARCGYHNQAQNRFCQGCGSALAQ